MQLMDTLWLMFIFHVFESLTLPVELLRNVKWPYFCCFLKGPEEREDLILQKVPICRSVTLAGGETPNGNALLYPWHTYLQSSILGNITSSAGVKHSALIKKPSTGTWIICTSSKAESFKFFKWHRMRFYIVKVLGSTTWASLSFQENKCQCIKRLITSL